jgi:hypothetical protein
LVSSDWLNDYSWLVLANLFSVRLHVGQRGVVKVRAVMLIGLARLCWRLADQLKHMATAIFVSAWRWQRWSAPLAFRS